MFNGLNTQNTPNYQIRTLATPAGGTSTISLSDDCAPLQLLYLATATGTFPIYNLYLPTNPNPGKVITIQVMPYNQKDFDANNQTSALVYVFDINQTNSSPAQITSLGPGGSITLVYVQQQALTVIASPGSSYDSNWVVIGSSTTKYSNYTYGSNSSHMPAYGYFNVIVGGATNRMWGTTTYSNITGGTLNSIGANTITTSYDAISGGYNNNITSSSYAVIAGGGGNTINSSNGSYNAIGGGVSNTIGSNANITAATIAGGNGNVANASYAFTAGTGNNASGTYSVALGQSNTSSGVNATAIGRSNISGSSDGVAIGYNNTLNSGAAGGVGIGIANTIASGISYPVAIGYGNSVNVSYGVALGVSNVVQSGATSSVALGYANNIYSTYSTATGYDNYINTSRDYSTLLGGYRSYSRCRGYVGFGSAVPDNTITAYGVFQAGNLVVGRVTTDATPSTLYANGVNASTFTVEANGAYYFRAMVVATVSGAATVKQWFVEGLVKRGATAATTAFVGTPTVTSTFADAGASTWALAVGVDTTNGTFYLQGTGAAATTIRWSGRISTSEVTY